MEQSVLATLVGQVRAALFATLNQRQHELLTSDEGDALSEIRGEFDTIIGTFLDERSDLFTLTLILGCLEQPTLFTRESVSFSSCISAKESPGQMNAQHCVYHNLCDLLRTTLEQEFSAWYQAQKEEGKKPDGHV